MAYLGRKRILNITSKGESAFIRYSAYSDGTDFTVQWSEGQNYIGFATGQTAPIDKADYTWAIFNPEETMKAYTNTKFNEANTEIEKKLDRVDEVTDTAQVYFKNANGENVMKSVAVDCRKNAIPVRNDNRTFDVGDPVTDQNPATKRYVDDGLGGKVDILTSDNDIPRAYVYTRDSQGSKPIMPELKPWSIVERNADNTFEVGDPTADKHPTPKKYVEDNFVPKLSHTDTNEKCLTINRQGEVNLRTQSVDIVAKSVPIRTSTGAISVPTPIDEQDATPKRYVDDFLSALQNQLNLIMDNPDTEGVINSLAEFTRYIEEHGEIAEGLRTDIGKKLDKKNNSSGVYPYLYGVDTANDQHMYKLTADDDAWSIPYRGNSKTFEIGEPIADAHPVTKKYADEKFVGKGKPKADANQIYGMDTTGEKVFLARVNDYNAANRVVMSNADGDILTHESEKPNAAVPYKSLPKIKRVYLNAGEKLYIKANSEFKCKGDDTVRLCDANGNILIDNKNFVYIVAPVAEDGVIKAMVAHMVKPSLTNITSFYGIEFEDLNEQCYIEANGGGVTVWYDDRK